MTSSDTHTAVITGAANGMGLATTRRFLSEGWSVIALDLHPEPLAQLYPQRSDALQALRVDVTQADQVEEAIGQAVPASDAVHTVVTAAGIYPPTTLETATTELYRQIFDVNVLGTLTVLQATAKHLRNSPGGANVVTFASVDAFNVSPGQVLYSASKAAVVSITRSLAVELADSGIVVNGVAPGWVETPGTSANERLRDAVGQIPAGRAADPDEIAEWVWRLGNTENRYVTGETLFISGGAALR